MSLTLTGSGRDADVGFYLRDPDGEALEPPHFVQLRRNGCGRLREQRYCFEPTRNWDLIEQAALLADPACGECARREALGEMLLERDHAVERHGDDRALADQSAALALLQRHGLRCREPTEVEPVTGHPGDPCARTEQCVAQESPEARVEALLDHEALRSAHVLKRDACNITVSIDLQPKSLHAVIANNARDALPTSRARR